MIRILVLLLACSVLCPAVSWSTLYLGTGSVGGTFGSWDQGGTWQEFWFSYSGPMELNLDKRFVEDPSSPGMLVPEIALGLSTLTRADWGIDGSDALGTTFFKVSSLGYVPRALMPPGYGPMLVALQDVTSRSDFFFVGAPDPSGSTIEITNSSFASNGYNLPFRFSGEVIPEPGSALLLATGLSMAIAYVAVARVRSGGARRT
jgi:hypothetical protein